MTMVNSGLKGLTLATLKYLCTNYRDQRVILNLKLSSMPQLALSASFEYVCYGSTAITYFFILSVRDRL